ncbi:hypothetical protein Tco_0013889 [Tanacetum coccineum]
MVVCKSATWALSSHEGNHPSVSEGNVFRNFLFLEAHFDWGFKSSMVSRRRRFLLFFITEITTSNSWSSKITEQAGLASCLAKQVLERPVSCTLCFCDKTKYGRNSRKLYTLQWDEAILQLTSNILPYQLNPGFRYIMGPRTMPSLTKKVALFQFSTRLVSSLLWSILSQVGRLEEKKGHPKRQSSYGLPWFLKSYREDCNSYTFGTLPGALHNRKCMRR